jgi:hypothetical protein
MPEVKVEHAKSKGNFVTHKEEEDYKALKTDLKDGNVSSKSIRSIIIHLIKNRTKFNVIDQEEDFYQSLAEWLPQCFKRKKFQNSAYKKRRLFEKGTRRYNKEMDIVTMLKTLRITKVLFRTMMQQKHRVLSQVQRTEVISSDSTDNMSSDYAELVNGLEHPKPMQRIFTLGKVNRALREYVDDDAEKMTPMTKRLLKGFYTQDRWELENDSE